ncbi:MAG: hypothetical protein ABR540_23495, partial [Acidimicrobiales bacterium]
GPGPEVDVVVELDHRDLVAGGSLVVRQGPSGSLSGERAPAGRFEPVFHTPLQVPGPDGRTTHLARALCRLELDDGRTGWVWAERLQPA